MSAEEIDARTGMVPGWTRRHTGVQTRFHVESETAAEMGANALRAALAAADWSGSSPQLLIGASGTPQQPIPCTASLIAGELGWDSLPCFDVNATCLSFVAAIELAGALLGNGNYSRIAVVSSEVASKGVNWAEPESAGLMGDGAAAVLLEADPNHRSVLLGTRMQTWPQGAAFAEIRGGGSRLPAVEYRPGENADDFLFHMDGPAVFRLAAEKIEGFVQRMVGTGSDRWDDIDWVIPHQASVPAIRRLRRRLGIPASKLVVTVQCQGNVVAASIPLALHEAVASRRLRRGQTVLLLGTSAGLTLGAALLRY